MQGRRLVSAAAGSATDPDIWDQARQLTETGVDFVKVGFSSAAQLPLLSKLRAAIAPPTGAIAVLFVDCPDIHPLQWILPAQAANLSGLMLDTADKEAGTLTQHIGREQAHQWVQATRQAQLLSGLAGRLDAMSATEYLSAQPDYLGFRGALCRANTRTREIDPEAVRELVDTLSTSQTASLDLPTAADWATPAWDGSLETQGPLYASSRQA